jgi:hypothetical protein
VSEPQSAEAVRAGDRACGPVADDWRAELVAYVRARHEADAELDDFRRRTAAHARLIADKMSELLPEGYRFEWR